MIIKKYKIVIIGSGPSGLQTALSLYKNGERSILILERDENLGGIPLQCSHCVYAEDIKGEDINGPDFISFYTDKIKELGIDYYTSCSAINITKQKSVTAISPSYGSMYIKAKAIIVATGAIEKPLSSLCIPSSRPNNIFTQGMAERLLNIEKKFSASSVIVIGANNTTTNFVSYLLRQNIKVTHIIDINNYYNETKELKTENSTVNIIHSSEIESIEGKPNVKGVKVDGNIYKCDTVIVSIGFEENRNILESSNISISNFNNKYYGTTDFDGVFVCGNAYKIFSNTEEILKSANYTAEIVLNYIKGSN